MADSSPLRRTILALGGPSWVLTPSVDVERRRRFEAHLGRAIQVYSGSSKGRCSRCGQEVWIGPRSREVVDLGATAPICETCIGAIANLTGWRPRAIVNLENPEGNRVG